MELLRDVIVPSEAAFQLQSNNHNNGKRLLWTRCTPGVPCNATCDIYQLIIWTSLWQKNVHQTGNFPLPSAMSSVDTSACHAVLRQQDKMQRYTDAKRGARPPSFWWGKRVKIRISHHVPKAHSRLTLSATVRKRIGLNSFLLSDGKTWNASHLAPFPSMAGQNCDTSTNPCVHVNHYPSHKQPWVKYKSRWHKERVIVYRKRRCCSLIYMLAPLHH